MSVRDSLELSVGIVQMAMSDSVEANDEAADRGIREAAGRGATLVCLPELYRSRYFCQEESDRAFALSEPVPGPTTEHLAELARELGICIVASLFERRAAGVYHNTSAVIDQEGYRGKYRKMHIPDDPRYFEKFYLTPGDLCFRSLETTAGQLGVLVCWDQWYPEAARLTAMQGAEILIYPTAIGWHPEEKDTNGAAQRDSWELVQRGHAVANGCFVVAVNRVGFEPAPDGNGGIEFWGSSFLAGPDGQILAQADTGKPGVFVTTLDLGAIERARIAWPFLRDRRIDAYSDLTRRWSD
ncbi:MAG TPA: carbon-nitrogen hydrolase [Gammaproteobacteria bacterium]|nr:carbon-nitrogen hydrolase [Gammaproteobacteria bacterium]